MKRKRRLKSCFSMLMLAAIVLLDVHVGFGNITVHAESTPSVIYQTHVQDIGWQDWTMDGGLSGTSGQSKRLEAIHINLQNADGSIQYRTHVQDIGWQDWTTDGATSGTSGQSKRLEAIQIQLAGNIANTYDIYYQVHVQDIGWQDWVANGQVAGTSGQSKRLEAIRIKLVPKTSSGNIPTGDPSSVQVAYQTHVQDIGWQGWVANGVSAGTSGQSKRLEAIRISTTGINGGIQYRTHVQDIGWQNWVTNGDLAGTSGQGKRLEAIQIQLTGDAANTYDVYYRVHVQDYGWLDWAKDGEVSGTAGLSKRLEMIQIVLVAKGGNAPGATSRPSINTGTTFGTNVATHVQDYGWRYGTRDGLTAGVVGESKRMEAFSISLENKPYSGSIQYNAHVQDIGWQGWTAEGANAGTAGQSKRIEAIQILLTGELSNYYDVYYRTYVQDYGWLEWACNGDPAGTSGFSKRMEAIEVRVVKKGDPAPGGTNRCYVAPTYNGIDVSKWQNSIDWSAVKASGQTFAMVKVSGGTRLDPNYAVNLQGAHNAGLRTGAYCYSYATSVAEAAAEAAVFVNALAGQPINYPVAYDVEDDVMRNAMTPAQVTDCILTFKSVVEQNGYHFILYANKDWLTNHIDMSRLGGVEIWFARYGRDLSSGYGDEMKDYNIVMWQYSSKGAVPGISGYVDMNICYKTY